MQTFFELHAMQNCARFVDLGKSFKRTICLQKSASIHSRTNLSKFGIPEHTYFVVRNLNLPRLVAPRGARRSARFGTRRGPTRRSWRGAPRSCNPAASWSRRIPRTLRLYGLTQRISDTSTTASTFRSRRTTMCRRAKCR